MEWVSIAVVGCLVVAAVVGLFVWGLARSAAVGDRDQLEQLAWARAVEADEAQGRLDSRRVGSDDRRTETRPWASAAPGRRAEDILRRDLAEAHRALSDAEERLVEIEARQSA